MAVLVREESKVTGRSSASLTTDVDDATLVERVRAGDDHAFRLLVERHAPRIKVLVAGMLRNASEIDDVVQDVFFKAYRKIDAFHGRSAFYTWLYRVAVNTANDHLKRKHHAPTASLGDLVGQPPVADDPDPDANLHRSDLRRQLRNALNELPEKYRTILVLREFEELTYDEIARVLGCSKGTVESRLFRARARLRDKLRIHLK